jgi:steroid Delta-isomerase
MNTPTNPSAGASAAINTPKVVPLPALARPMPPGPPDPRVARVIDFYDTLTPTSLAGLDKVYTESARFVDPFNDVSGHTAIRRVFEHMFQVLEAPCFQVVLAVSEGDNCFLLWNFRFHPKGGRRASPIHGSTHLRFGADGRVAVHRDYWDPAREVYETVPLLGTLMRWLRRKLATPGPADGLSTTHA